MYKFKNGDYYEGDWVNGLKNGTGKMYTQVDDKLFEGEFKNNHKHGNGKLMTGDGQKVIERGVWKNDVKSWKNVNLNSYLRF